MTNIQTIRSKLSTVLFSGYTPDKKGELCQLLSDFRSAYPRQSGDLPPPLIVSSSSHHSGIPPDLDSTPPASELPPRWNTLVSPHTSLELTGGMCSPIPLSSQLTYELYLANCLWSSIINPQYGGDFSAAKSSFERVLSEAIEKDV
jgi:hypothetical protein